MAKVERAALTHVRSPDQKPREVPAAKNDVDGDGRADRVTMAPGPTGATSTYRVTAHLTRLGVRTVLVEASSEGGQLIGIQDMDGDGYGEIIVRYDHGASTDFWTVVRLVNGQLVQMTQNGASVALPIGGSVTHQGGFDCNANYPGVWTPGYLLELGYGWGDGGKAWSGEKVKYRYDGAQLVQVSKQTQTWTQNGPAIDSHYSGVRCGALTNANVPWTPLTATPEPSPSG
jgi:hypothetical protein